LREAVSREGIAGVTIDFWDTLVERTQPADLVRARVCDWIVTEWGMPLTGPQLHAVFDDMATAMCVASLDIGQEYEYRSAAVWRCVLREVADCDEAESADRAVRIYAAEVRESIAGSTVNPEVRRALAEAGQLPSLVVSDNEMSSEQLSAIAAGHGLRLPRILVSSEQGRSKRSGALLLDALRHLALEPARVMHIGDDPMGDRKSPRNLGMQLPSSAIPASGMPSTPSGPDGQSAGRPHRGVTPEGLGMAVGHFVADAQRTLRAAGSANVILVGSEGAFFSTFFDRRPEGDDNVYLVSNLGRRHFLGAALCRDPSWVVQRSVLSNVRAEGLGALALDPLAHAREDSEAWRVGCELVLQLWSEGVVEADSLPRSAETYEAARGVRLRGLGLGLGVGEAWREVVVIDIGYRATSARAIGMLADRRVTSLALFGDRPYIAGESLEASAWLSLEGRRTSPAEGQMEIPRELLPLEVLLAEGPRAPRGDAHLVAFRREVVSSARRSLAQGEIPGPGSKAQDAEAWTALVTRPPRDFARSVFDALHIDDLQSPPRRRRRPRLLTDRAAWLPGSNAVLGSAGGALLDRVLDVARKTRMLVAR
jgi:FMN phosphatase YigB (HAD superfamily)